MSTIDDLPSAFEINLYAALDAAISSRRSLGPLNGRDWTGILIEHPMNCRGSCCVPDAVSPPTTPFGKLFGLAYEQSVVRFANDDWWSMFGAELFAAEAAGAADYRVNRAAIEAANNARIAAADARLKAERVAIRVGAMCTKRRAEIAKVAQPCKFLYNCQGTPARPTTLSVTTECWSHEYTDPVTGAKIAKHVCDRMHPGEEGWLREWSTDRNFRIAAAPAPAVRTWDERPAPRAPPRGGRW